METNFNLGSLKIVQAPLMEYFNKALTNIERNLVLVRDEKKVPTNHDAIDLLVKMQKTLEMIGLKGLSRVLSVTEEGLIAVKEVRFDSKKNSEILEVAAQILKSSTTYIQRLISSGVDHPKQFYSDYQKMSNFLGKESHIKDLFFPKLDLIEDINEQIKSDLRAGIFINENSRKNLITHLEKVQNIVQSKLPTIFNTIDLYGEFDSNSEKTAYQNVCKQLYESFDYAQKLKINKNFFILFGIYKLYICILSPVFNENFLKYVATRQSLIKSSLSKIERVVARLIQNVKEMEVGEKTGSIRLDDDVVKEIILELVYSLKDNPKLMEMPVYKDLEEYFDLAYYSDQLDETMLNVEKSNQLLSVEQIQEIEKNFLDLKEGFNALCYKKDDADDFPSHVLKLINTNKNFLEIASKELHPLVSQVGSALELVKSNFIKFNVVLQREISLALVLSEYGINSFVKHSVEERRKKDFLAQTQLQISRLKAVCNNDLDSLDKLELPKVDAVSQKSDEKKTFVKIFTKLEDDLIKIEETLDYYLKNEGENLEDLHLIYKPLVSMKGIFNIIGKSDLGKVVDKITEPWKKINDNGQETVSREELNESISLLGGLSLLVKASVSNNENSADQLYANLMKTFYQKNVSEIEKDVGFTSFMNQNREESVENVETAQNPVVEVEEEEVVFDFAIEEQPDNQAQPFSFEQPVTPVEEKFEFVKEDVTPVEVIEVNSVPPIKTYTEGTNDPDLAEVFLMEAEEVLQNMGSAFEALNSDLNNSDELTNLKRYFHTLKGSGRMVGLEFMGEAAWMVEQTLNKCLEGEINFDLHALNSTKEMKIKFDHWVESLKSSNQVTVDLVSVKKVFIAINPMLTNHVDVPLDAENVSSDDNVLPVENSIETEVEKPTQDFSLEISEERFEFQTPAEPVADDDNVLPVENSIETEVEKPTQDFSLEISEERFGFQTPAEPVADVVIEGQENNDTMYINGNAVSIELYNLYKLESEANIEALKHEANANHKGEVYLTEEFMRNAHTLSSISKSVHLTEIGDLAKKLEDFTTLAIEKNVQITQEQMNVVREVINNLESFQDLDFSKHPSNFAYLDAKLNTLYKDINCHVVHKDVEEDHKDVEEENPKYVAQIDTEALKSELFEEIKNIVNDHNKKLLEDVINREDVSKKFVKDLILKIDGLEEKLGEMKESQKEKDGQFEKHLLEMQSAQKERERLYNKALEVTKNDIRNLAHIIKKKYEIANQAILHESDREELIKAGLNSQEAKPAPEITEIMAEYSVEIKNLTDLVEEVEVKNPITAEDIQEVDGLLNNMVDSDNSTLTQKTLSEEDSKIKEILEKHSFILTVFEDKVASVQDEIDVDLYEISKEESQEMFETINPLIEQINQDGLSIDDSKALKRYLHTLKGSLRMAGANKVGMLAHRLESLLDYVESRKINLFGFKPLLEKEMDKIAFLMKDPTQTLSENRIAWLDQVIDESAQAKPRNEDAELVNVAVKEDNISQNVKQESKKEVKQFIRVSSDIVDSAINDAGEIRLARSYLEDTTSNTKKSISELKNSSGKLLKMVKEIEVQADAQIQAHSSQINENDLSFDPLEFDKFTRLQELTRLMSEAVSDIEETITSLNGTAKVQDNAINKQSIITNNLLSQLLKVRLVSVESISERFYKIARNTAKELGKRVSLEIIGEKTEIDKLILDKVISPIEHLLRNSIAHGIEVPEKRLEMGKQPVGKIKIDVSLDGNFTIIKIQDDGAGINTDKIREIAIKKGMIKEDLEYSKDEIINLIFQSGFSTADSVSQVAGRGVGMDVVKNDILAVGGTIKIETEKNQGSVFALTLPMEVATTQAMLCKVKEKLIAIPATLIEEVDSVKEDKIKKAYSTSQFTVNGVDYPFYYAGALLGLVDSGVVPDSKLYNTVVRINYMDKSIVVHVDKLVTTTEILIKNLGTIYNKISGLLGVTVLGDGSQGVVINPVQMIDHLDKNLKNANVQIQIDKNKSVAVNKVTVLVVDDSITVRHASSKMLERNNFNVILAKDGEDALEQLQVYSPNIILSDIEMPRMDGFQFVKNIRSVDKYSHIPIIMITSRTAEKHQKRAFELGANDFLGKPYKEEELIEKIQNLLEYNKELV